MRVLALALSLVALLPGRGETGPLNASEFTIQKERVDVGNTAYNLQDSDHTETPGSISLDDDTGFTIDLDGHEEATEDAPSPWDGWVYGGLAEGMLSFQLESEDPQCSREGRLYRQNLQNHTLWAVRMFDSSALSANGLVSADGFQFGHFDECVAIEAAAAHDHPSATITGKYCLATVRLAPDPDRPRWHERPESIYAPLPADADAWDRIKVSGDPRQLRRDTLRWAVCVPSSCAAQDVRRSLSRSLASPLARRGVRSQVTVAVEDCYSVREAPPFSTGYFIVMGLMYFMIFLCVLCTALDYMITDDTKVQGSVRHLVKVFSTYSNMRKLVKSNPKAEFKLLHCLKYFSMQCVILGHKEMYLFGRPVQNTEFVEGFYSYWTSLLFLNGGNYIVDTFFVFSGFLTCHFMVRELEKRKSINLPMVVIAKVLRILPVYAFVLAFHATVLPYLGSGPLWNELVWREALRCQKNWWTNMLFINNYVNVDEMCMIQSWYLACDMHYFIVGVALIALRYRHPRLGNVTLALALALAVAVPTYITYVNRYWGVVRLHHGLQMDPVKEDHFLNIYVPSHARFIPYMVGLIMSYLCQHLIKTGFKFPGAWLSVLVPLGVVINLTTIVIAYVFYVEERPYSLFENVFYAGFHRILWALVLVFLIIVDTTTGIGKWGSIFRHRSWAPLGRLTYCAFLIHTIPMIYSTGMMRSAPYHTRTMAALTLLGDVSLSFFLALFVNLIFESPLQRVMKMALKNVLGAPPKTGLAEKNMQQVAESQLTLTDKLPETGNGTGRIRYRDENGVYKS